MIQAEVHRNGELLMKRVYSDPALTLQQVAERLALYVEEEHLNELGECQLRVRRGRGGKRKAKSDLKAG